MATTKETQVLQKDKPLSKFRQPAEELTLKANDTDKNHDVFIQRLLEQGVIPFIPKGRPGPPPRAVPFQGPPISETLVEERR